MTPFWKSCARADHLCGDAKLVVLTAPPLTKPCCTILAKACQAHYVSRKWLRTFGRGRLADRLDAVLPTTIRQRSGDLGEILATEYVNLKEWGYEAPVFRLRWKDGRDLALRGDDVVAFNLAVSPIGLLKGESKSRAVLGTATLNDAHGALRKNRGRPAAFVIAFIIDQLVDQGKIALARRIEKDTSGAQLLQKRRLANYLFVVCGNDPTKLLGTHLTPIKTPGIDQYAVALHCADHQLMIKRVYSEASRA